MDLRFIQVNLSLLSKLAVIGCVLLSFTPTGFGVCFQPNPTVGCEFLNSEAVFVGTVVSVRQVPPRGNEFDEGWLYSVKPLEWFRGTRAATVKVFTENNSGRYELDVGKKYLLFAIRHGGRLQIGNCGNSAPFPEAQPTVEKLRRLKIPINAVIEGRVSFSGIPDRGAHVPGIQVVIRSDQGTFKATTDRDGWFHFYVPAGRYSAEVLPFPDWDITPYDLSIDDSTGFDTHTGHCSSLQFIAKAK